jgi:hypothetical protein
LKPIHNALLTFAFVLFFGKNLTVIEIIENKGVSKAANLIKSNKRLTTDLSFEGFRRCNHAFF